MFQSFLCCSILTCMPDKSEKRSGTEHAAVKPEISWGDVQCALRMEQCCGRTPCSVNNNVWHTKTITSITRHFSLRMASIVSHMPH